MNEPNDDLRLRKLMRESLSDQPLPPRFQARVWQRIESAEKSAAARSGFSLAGWLTDLFARPAYATAWVALLLVIGVSTGYLLGGHQAMQWDAQLSGHYAASINPYLADNR